MTEKSPIVIPLLDDADVTLESIEFDNDFEGDDEHPHRTVFQFRLYLEEGVYRDFPVTMTEPYKNLDDLHHMAWQELYILLRQFAELSRRKCDAPEITFDAPK